MYNLNIIESNLTRKRLINIYKSLKTNKLKK